MSDEHNTADDDGVDDGWEQLTNQYPDNPPSASEISWEEEKRSDHFKINTSGETFLIDARIWETYSENDKRLQLSVMVKEARTDPEARKRDRKIMDMYSSRDLDDPITEGVLNGDEILFAGE